MPAPPCIPRQPATAHRRPSSVTPRTGAVGLALLLVVTACSGGGRDARPAGQPTAEMWTPRPGAGAPGTSKPTWNQPMHGTLPESVNMHDVAAPPSRWTTGSADIDGNGKRDTVEVDTRGLISVHLAHADSARARVSSDPSLRLQALPDLDGDGDREVLLAWSAAPCCGYRFTDSTTQVLQYEDGRLQVVRQDGDRPLTLAFGSGRGDVYAGVRCKPRHRLVQKEAVLRPGGRLRISATTYRLMHRTAVWQGRRQWQVQNGWREASKVTASSCVGMASDGWAPVRR